MTTVDHAAEAQKHYEEAVEANQNGKWETSRFEMKLAEFHIAAAGVEQQRLANLMEVAKWNLDLLRRGSPHRDGEPADVNIEIVNIDTIARQVREGLRL